MLDAHADLSTGIYNIGLCSETKSINETLEQISKNKSLNFELFACLGERAINYVTEGSTLITLIEYNYLSLEPLDNELIIKSASFIPHDNPFIRFASYIFINPSIPRFTINLHGTKKFFPNETFLSKISKADLISQKWRNDMLSEFITFASYIKSQTKVIGEFYNQIETLEEVNLLQNKSWLDQFDMTRIRELAFINAVHAADLDMAELFLNSTDVDRNATLESVTNALIIAILALHTSSTNLTGKDKGKTKEAYSNIAVMLINYGISLDKQELGGDTALHLALSRNFTEVALYLIRKGALLTIENNAGATPIYLAAQNGFADIVEAMLEKDPSLVNIQMDDGKTPLYIASQNGHVKIVNLLLDYGVHVNAEKVINEGNTKITPLDITAYMCYEGWVLGSNATNYRKSCNM